MIKVVFHFLSVLIVCGGCIPHTPTASVAEKQSLPLYYFGRIDARLLTEVQQHHGEKRLHIFSGGGSVEIALSVAELLRQDSWSLHIYNKCLSACADILLLGSDNITAEAGSLIGFHGDSLMKNDLYRRVSLDAESDCFLTHQHREDALILQARANGLFWKEQVQRIKPYDLNLGRPNEKDGCRLLNYRLKYDFWYPTSTQLSELYGVQISGELAADNTSKYVEQIHNYHPRGRSAIFGDG